MKRLRFPKVLLVLMCFLLSPLAAAQAITITYEVEDLAAGSLDTINGDVWKYTYRVSDLEFDINFSFMVYFDYNACGHIETVLDTISGNNEWRQNTFDPDPNIPDDGAFMAEALGGPASLEDPFVVSFISLSARPVQQYFEIYNADYEVIACGQTKSLAAAIPEPAGMMLLGSGLIGLAWVNRRK